ncbi:MAG: DNA double-strand break repair nuclease NurA [archaeon]
MLINKMDLSQIRIRLENINKKATKFVSFMSSELKLKTQDFYLSPTMTCLEEPDSIYPVKPKADLLSTDWNIYAYDESLQNYRALEGDLLFFSAAIIKLENKYNFNLSVLPYFLTSIQKFKESSGDDIRFTENLSKERNSIMVNSKTKSILDSVEPNSIVLVDGPLIGGNASEYLENMDDELRKMNCIPIYFVKNSDSRLVIDSNKNLAKNFNSDFHWSAIKLRPGSRSPFFKYTDEHNKRNTKVFTYQKALFGFPERVEMHTPTYIKYQELIPELMELISYFFLVQGDRSNLQVRPIAIAEKYAREGLKVLNIPALLSKLGFRPTINQVRFG